VAICTATLFGDLSPGGIDDLRFGADFGENRVGEIQPTVDGTGDAHVTVACSSVRIHQLGGSIGTRWTACGPLSGTRSASRSPLISTIDQPPPANETLYAGDDAVIRFRCVEDHRGVYDVNRMSLWWRCHARPSTTGPPNRRQGS
jgi:hypothetical protein